MMKRKIKTAVAETIKPFDLEPMRQMVLDMDAIYQLAKSRDIDSLKTAHMLARRISYNDILFALMSLEKEYWAKPFMQRH